MTDPIYLDVYFCMNLGMNLLILCAEKRLLRLSAKWPRLMISGVVGAAFSCLVFFLPEGWFRWYAAGTLLILGPAMAGIAFGYGSFGLFLRKLAGFYLVTVLLAGILEVLRQFLPGMVGASQMYAALGWIFLSIGAIWLVRILLGLMMGWQRKRNFLYQVTIHYQGMKKQVNALLDSGNRLQEPYSGKAVHVITYGACKDICKTVTGVLYVPFHAVGTGAGMLPAIYLDAMEVFQAGKLITRVERPLFAIIRHTLSSDGEYDMLLNEGFEGEIGKGTGIRENPGKPGKEGAVRVM